MPDIQLLLNAIDQAEERSYGSDTGGELERERAFSLDFYHGRNIEPAPEGRSQVVDRSLFETVQQILPSLCRIFANGDNIVEFVPFGEEDEEQARQEGDYLNYLVTQKNPWFQTFLTWAQDALLMKNAYCLAFIEEKTQTETETYENQSEQAIAFLLQGDGVEVVSLEESEIDAEPEVSQDEFGNPLIHTPQFFNITIRRSKPQRQLRFKVLPPERCKIAEQTESFSLEECDYFEYWDDVTISSLREMGFDVPDDIATGDELEAEVEFARDLYDETVTRDGTEPLDPAMRTVRARTIWIRHDYDEDGLSELQKVVRVGNQVLKDEDGALAIEQVSRIPVACIVPNINTHRHIGTSIADMVIDIQRIETAILRQGLDSLYQANSPRHAISDKVNLDDMSITAPGWNVRLEDGAIPGEGHIMPLQTPFVFPQAMQGLEYFDQVKEKRTGASRFSTGVDPDILNKSPSGVAVNQLSTMAAQRIEQVARIIASGVEYLFSVAHELVLKSGHQTDAVKLRNKWVQVDPSQWKSGRDMRIVVGFGAGNKDSLLQRVVMILQAQREAIAGGLRVATEQNVYEALIEMTKAADFTAPERFWTDPVTLGPSEPKPTEGELFVQSEQEKRDSQERIKAAELQSGERVKAAEIAQRDRSDALEAETMVFLEQIKAGGSVDLEQVRARLRDAQVTVDNRRIEEAATLQEAHSAQIEALEASLSEQTEQFRQMLQQLSDSLVAVVQQTNAPREVVRDSSGKVVGLKVNGQTREVKRDGQGRVVGLQ